MKTRDCLFLTICLAILAGCGSTTHNDNQLLTGDWAGTATDSTSGTGTFTVYLVQVGPLEFAGLWHLVLPAAGYDNGGDLHAAWAGSSLFATLQPSVPTYCPLKLVASFTSTTMTGTYATINCSGVMAGTVTAHR